MTRDNKALAQSGDAIMTCPKCHSDEYVKMRNSDALWCMECGHIEDRAIVPAVARVVLAELEGENG